GEESEAPTEQLDIACGLENLPVTAWPPGAAPEPFQVPKLALFAARDISPGEELSYDYSGRFLNGTDSDAEDRQDDGTPRKPCYCGARSCAAFLPYDSSLYHPAERPDVT
ncbi:histone-lysine N-methyltransferase SETMAR, partial [Pteropus vampyrus]|uniref:Histone-lysine N-methyltransferase SETMAR n=1 Tax=Pteropus vampyrus TaxID=132908 RepID=A0A6P3QF72_PTEVA